MKRTFLGSLMKVLSVPLFLYLGFKLYAFWWYNQSPITNSPDYELIGERVTFEQALYTFISPKAVEINDQSVVLERGISVFPVYEDLAQKQKWENMQPDHESLPGFQMYQGAHEFVVVHAFSEAYVRSLSPYGTNLSNSYAVVRNNIGELYHICLSTLFAAQCWNWDGAFESSLQRVEEDVALPWWCEQGDAPIPVDICH